MIYSSLDLTNISYAAAFVYLSAKEKSRGKISTVPSAFDVDSSDISIPNKVSCYKYTEEKKTIQQKFGISGFYNGKMGLIL